MQIFYKKIIAISAIFGVLFVFFEQYNLLVEIPGFYCEGFGCMAIGIYYLFIAIILIPVVVSVIGYFISTDAKWKSVLHAFFIALGIMTAFIILLMAWNDF